MTIGIMQPYLFPYIGYWQLINAVDKFVIYDDVNFIKQGWINRNSILINGKSNYITLSLNKASSHSQINQIELIDNSKKMLKTIEMNYKKAPYYSKNYEFIKEVFSIDETNLALFVGNSIIKFASYLEIKTEFIYSSEIKKNNDLKGQDKVLEICKKLNADNYINAIGGQSLYSKDVFSNYNISLLFLESEDIKYLQFKKDFVPNLSIIDILMFNSIDQVRKMLDEYKLV